MSNSDTTTTSWEPTPSNLKPWTDPISNPESSSSSISSHLEKQWTALLNYAASLDYSSSAKHDELVTFITTLQNQPDPETAVNYHSDKQFHWSNLPDFNIYARDRWNYVTSDSDEDEQKKRWPNLNAFFAKLTAVTLREGGRGVGAASDYSLYGLWTLRQALEEKKVETAGWEEAAAAAVWVVYCGEGLKGLCTEGKEFDGRVAVAGERFGGWGWRGFSLGRWGIWKGEFERLLEVGGGREEVRKIVEEAVGLM